MVTMDCAYFRFEKEIEDAADHLLSGLESGDQEGVRSWSQLQPALLRRFNAIARSGESNTKKLAASNAALAEVMGRALAQLGPEIAAWLEYWLFEYQEAAPGRVDVPDDILEALLGAELATVDAVSDEVRLASGPARERVEEALRDYLARVLEPPARWSDLVEALFTLERMVRLAVKREMTDHFGQDWREHIPNGPAAKATSRASADVPAYSSVKAIPNPLDWMTLSELAQVADYCCVEFKCVAGIRAEVWRSLFTEVEPIRNRAAHMRLMRLGDLDSARRWGRQLRMRSPGSFED